ncbi:uncharacterized protein LOC117968042 isoform X2 [Acipenser ruthenus]|uniref:uncharacterized protein LOC117968042 isoform X2 n=1 Tax=Acipenser ruthenus TaxID=7906 RepID=UPI0027412281|nr:uncharacterized protein LOC117968042 isoform X2 [Acipenser ruthenus]
MLTAQRAHLRHAPVRVANKRIKRTSQQDRGISDDRLSTKNTRRNRARREQGGSRGGLVEVEASDLVLTLSSPSPVDPDGIEVQVNLQPDPADPRENAV